MELQNIVMTQVRITPNALEKEKSNGAPTRAEIRLRAFEIHDERGGIHRLALDTRQEVHANFDKGSKTSKEKETGNEVCHRDDMESRQRSVILKSSLFAWYHILRTQHHWTIFQAIRYALWLVR